MKSPLKVPQWPQCSRQPLWGMAAGGEEQKGKKSSESLMANALCEQISINHETWS